MLNWLSLIRREKKILIGFFFWECFSVDFVSTPVLSESTACFHMLCTSVVDIYVALEDNTSLIETKLLGTETQILFYKTFHRRYQLCANKKIIWGNCFTAASEGRRGLH